MIKRKTMLEIIGQASNEIIELQQELVKLSFELKNEKKKVEDLKKQDEEQCSKLEEAISFVDTFKKVNTEEVKKIDKEKQIFESLYNKSENVLQQIADVIYVKNDNINKFNDRRLVNDIKEMQTDYFNIQTKISDLLFCGKPCTGDQIIQKVTELVNDFNELASLTKLQAVPKVQPYVVSDNCSLKEVAKELAEETKVTYYCPPIKNKLAEMLSTLTVPDSSLVGKISG